MPKLLFIEDDKMLGQAVHTGLKPHYTVDWFRSAEDGEEAIANEHYDALVLDVNLPGMSGIEWLTQLRQRKNPVPVLLLTARDAIQQRVEGLDAGADDYLVKPFDFDELLARIRAMLRRRTPLMDSTLQHGDIVLDTARQVATKAGVTVTLSSRELAILTLLMERQGHCLSKRQIEEQLYGFGDEVESNTVEVHISALRRKLGKELIKTIRGVGYIIES